jgi:chemotaxis protein methyltransferase CheR
MGTFPQNVEMTPELFRLFRDLVYDYCGIFFQEDVKYLLEKRLSSRLQVQQVFSFSEYYQYLRYGKDRKPELELIVELLTTNETYFFREEYQLRAFSEEIVPILIQEKGQKRKLRIWSAGCSTGEEVYSIAMLIREDERLRDWDIEIFGNDISRKVLQVARKGLYGKSSFRVLSEYYKKKYFHPVDKSYRVDDSLRGLVSFGHLNLLDDEMLQLIPIMDIVFCRNVLIYFDKTARMRVLKTFFNKLRAGGYLLLGHSESLVNVSTDYELVYLKNDMVYQKPIHGLGEEN